MCLFGKCTQHAPPPAGRARGQPVCVSSCEASLSLCCSLLLHSHSATHLFQLHQPSPYFDLGDPYCRHLRAEYNSLHDPYLQDYHNRKDNLQNLKNRGLITEDGKVVCTLKEFNEYRQYLTRLKLEREKIKRQKEVGKTWCW
ncbi:fibrous sheath-interacting protein 2 [Meleagris gallopavo]|uniref:fibrous sheath-interacting protein 2 n=1 Tax=Meleagris gallopavo TaxID=9103 RepID=UPI00093D3D1E|nr:fibrous sheath-interacting protein 2 [Meleagris gallopavo]